jgi:hypothetical protein
MDHRVNVPAAPKTLGEILEGESEPHGAKTSSRAISEPEENLSVPGRAYLG